MIWARTQRGRTILLAALFVACYAERGEHGRSVVRDSLGVSIVDHADPILPEWLLDTIPFLRIGTIEGEDGQDIGGPWSVARLSNGRIAVSDSRPNLLRLYNADGTFHSNAGRSGRGPGEFSQVGAIHVLPGDTLLVEDGGRRRVHLFDGDGVFVRTHNIEPAPGRAWNPTGVFAGDVLVYLPVVASGVMSNTGIRRDTFELVIRRLASSDAISVGRFPAGEWSDLSSGGFRWSSFRPYYGFFYLAYSDSLLWAGLSDTWEVWAWNAAGRLRRVVRVARPAHNVSAEDRAEYIEYQIRTETREDHRRGWRRAGTMIDFPDRFPAFDRLMADSEGYLWIRDYEVPWDPAPSVWRVFREDGPATALVRTPHDFTVYQIGADFVLGTSRDSLGVYYVDMLRLRRQ